MNRRHIKLWAHLRTCADSRSPTRTQFHTTSTAPRANPPRRLPSSLCEARYAGQQASSDLTPETSPLLPEPGIARYTRLLTPGRPPHGVPKQRARRLPARRRTRRAAKTGEAERTTLWAKKPARDAPSRQQGRCHAEVTRPMRPHHPLLTMLPVRADCPSGRDTPTKG